MPVKPWEQWITSAGDVKEGTTFEARQPTASGRHDCFDAVTEFIPHKRFAYRLRSGNDAIYRSFDLQSQGEGTLVTLQGRLKLSPLRWIAFPILHLSQHRMGMKALDDIKTQIETMRQAKAA